MKNKTELLKKLNDNKEEMLNDCWNYHKDIIKASYQGTKKEDLDYVFGKMELEGWEDVGFFAGYIAGIEYAEKIINQ